MRPRNDDARETMVPPRDHLDGLCCCGFMFATAITGPIPAAADWRRSITCPAGQQLVHEEYVTQSSTPPSHTGTGVGFTYRWDPESGSRTAIVLLLQFVAGRSSRIWRSSH
jgi:hypothetical protein